MKGAEITLRQLRYFVMVAEELHFGRAAAKLHITQPPLTQRIHELERHLGVELFTRVGNKVDLTEAGKIVLSAAKDTLADAEGVCNVAQRVAKGEFGQLRIATASIGTLFLPSIQQAMRTFQQEHPGLSLELTVTPSALSLEGLRQRKLDVCFMRLFTFPLPPECEAVAIARDRLMLVLPAGHPLTAQKTIPLSAIADEKYVSTSKKRIALREQIAALWDKAGLKPPRASQQAEDGPALLALVAAGFGIAILPSLLQALQFQQIVWRTIDCDERWTASSMNLVYHRDSLAEQRPAAFIDFLKQHFRRTSNVIPLG